MDRKAVLLLGVSLVALVVVSSFLLIEVINLREELNQLREELAALKRWNGDYSYNSDWVTRFVGYNPIASVAEAKGLYLLLVSRAPRRSYWIYYLPEDNGLPLEMKTQDVNGYYQVNGTFRNYAVNCANARLTIVYSVFKNGTANLEHVITTCSGLEYPQYP